MSQKKSGAVVAQQNMTGRSSPTHQVRHIYRTHKSDGQRQEQVYNIEFAKMYPTDRAR